MRIWHEKLIPLLCQKHLCAMWREGLGCYKIITEGKKGYANHPAVKEFEHALPALIRRLILVSLEMKDRGYHPKSVHLEGSGASVSENEWQTLDEQIAILKAKGCKCKV